MGETGRYAENLTLETGFLCLDFANTMDMHASDNPEESLFAYSDLVSWSREVGVLDGGAAQQLQRRANRSAAEAESVFQKAIELREAIYRIFSAIAGEESAPTADIALLNETLPQASAHQFIVESDAGFRWVWWASADELDQMLWPVARSAADLLASDQLDRVRECADERGCGFLFFDTSRNRSRRWCSMESCGNRAKAQRHYHRQHAGGE